METVTVLDLIKQLGVVFPSVIIGSQALTAVIRGSLNIKSGKAIHAINWIIGTLAGAAFVLLNGLTFGIGQWADIILGAVAGLIGAGASNGLYEWKKIKAIFSALADGLGNFIYNMDYYKNIPDEQEPGSEELPTE